MWNQEQLQLTMGDDVNSKKQKIGLIAQDVEKVLPEVVEAIDDGKFLGVDYQALVPVLIEAVKDLHAELEGMKKEMHELRMLLAKK